MMYETVVITIAAAAATIAATYAVLRFLEDRRWPKVSWVLSGTGPSIAIYNNTPRPFGYMFCGIVNAYEMIIPKECINKIITPQETWHIAFGVDLTQRILNKEFGAFAVYDILGNNRIIPAPEFTHEGTR